MASTPIDDNDPAVQERIRTRAYHMWEDEGRPHHREGEYWERARELVHMELSAGTGQLPNPASLPGADPSAPVSVEEASIQENLGEFPDRFADQGEKTPTPRARPRKAAAPAPAPAAATKATPKAAKPAPPAAPGAARPPAPAAATPRKAAPPPPPEPGSAKAPPARKPAPGATAKKPGTPKA